MPKTIAITGANGFIGQRLVLHFTLKGYKVRALARTPFSTDAENVEHFHYDLFDDGNIEALQGADVVIHCAHAFTNFKHNNQIDVNYNATKQLKDCSEKYNVGQFIFLSSLSAHENTLSDYGKAKLKIEKLLCSNQDLVLKPGLVLGDGGLFARLKVAFQNNQFIPVIGNGLQPLYTVALGELVQTIDLAINHQVTGNFTVAGPQPVTMIEFYQLLKKHLKTSCYFVKVPYWAIQLLLSIAKMLGIKLPVTKENVLGLKSMQVFDTQSAISKFNIQYLDTNQTIQNLFE